MIGPVPHRANTLMGIHNRKVSLSSAIFSRIESKRALWVIEKYILGCVGTQNRCLELFEVIPYEEINLIILCSSSNHN